MVSLDAVADGDIDFLLGLPNFASLCSCGTLVREVDSVFVSNTYPAHSSIITGMYPEKHGLTQNVLTQPGKAHPDWCCEASKLRAPTLYDRAAAAGQSVCSVLYPVTCGANIRWNIPEIPGGMSILRRAGKMLSGGSAGFILGSLLRNIRHLKGFSISDLDDLSTRVAAGALRDHKPGLLLLHLVDADEQKHRFGPESGQVKAALRRHDARLGKLVDAMREAWPGEEPAIILFSDHGCLAVHTAVDPNDYLKRRGLIREPGRRAEDFYSFFYNAGGTAFLKILRSEKTEEAMRAVSGILCEPFVKRMLTEQEMKTSGMKNAYACGIEAADGFCFGEKHAGQHGYSLEREGYRPFYLAAGSGIERGKVKKGGCIVDICPLAADLLGIPLWEMDGRNRLKENSN